MKIAVINGPNLNMLGQRNSNHYGTLTLDEIEKKLIKSYPMIEFDFFQSNHEGTIIDIIQNLDADGLIINPAGYTHTSVSIRDALEIKTFIKVEVHLSDLKTREDFRQINLIKDVVDYSIAGKKELGYLEAVEYIKRNLNKI